ncbi:TolC family outer membrane protein [Ketobacter sp. MCCC 1A13808]|nr:TolC family outer membrane protein [Ketobacter sp. MCCC 1A13808]
MDNNNSRSIIKRSYVCPDSGLVIHFMLPRDTLTQINPAMRNYMKKHRLRSALVSGICLMAASLSVAETLNLQRTYELALQNDPQWAAVKDQYSANQQVIDQGRSTILPQITLRGNVAKNEVEYDGFGDDKFDSKGYSAEIVQPLFRLNNWHTFKRSEALNSQFDADYHNDTQDFYLRVVTSYLEVLRSNANMEYRKAEQEAISRQLEQSKQRFDVGLVAITDVHEAQAAYDTAVSERISAETEQFVALRLLETITGATVDDVVDLKEDLPILPPDPIDINQWLTISMEHNAALQSAIFAAKAAEQDYKAKRGDHAPTVDLVGAHAYDSSDSRSLVTSTTNPDTTTNRIAIQVELPLYSGGNTSANRRQSKYQFLASQDVERLRRREVIQDTTNFYQLVIANVAQVNARKQSSLSAKVALDATQAGYEAGTRTIVDVLNVQRNLFQNERDYANSRFDYILNGLRLKRVAGMLTEQEVLALQQWMKNS